ncbi:M23 family metallopeptidase [Virgibacillus sp. YIM 98842]|jgi:stage IV sporulation protein FA|uniref:M23 family metallopeptidase n=1 Tax=Virgibacillus sp. YIM 98842 TaxID=2663533 RepID=UPI0013DA57E0|nr:M23 family metallopeptidase [Virgibacillus sp. YIM 98842]
MKRGVKKVRKSIEQRKKTRGYPFREESKKQIMSPLPQEEEKHGYLPVFSDASVSSKKDRAVSGFFLKGTLSIMLFFGAALLWQTDSEVLESPKRWSSIALTQHFPFAKVNAWYQETFGSPLAFTPRSESAAVQDDLLALPVNGNVTETFQSNGKGIMIEPGETTDVAALREGIVIFAGNDKETNKTIIIQHPDGTNSTYGFLSSIDVHLYQYVGSNQRVGQFSPSESDTVYFAIEKDNDYIDPVQVIQVDDQE